jgi:hypothetical protein
MLECWNDGIVGTEGMKKKILESWESQQKKETLRQLFQTDNG